MAKSQAKRDAAKRKPAHKKRIGTHKRVAPDRFDPKTPLPDVAIPAHIIEDILEKKDLLASRELTEHITLRYLRKKPALINDLEKPHIKKTAGYEEMKKWVRQELRVLVGMFVLKHDVKNLLKERTATILASHRSTAERQAHYPGLYDALFGARKPEVILDLCCGLNPCSYEYLGCKPIYYAIDVSPQLMDFVDSWFQAHGIVGKAEAKDVTKLTSFPDADTVLIFKGMDVLERIKYGHGDTLLDLLAGRRIIVSFATATISGTRDISLKKRTWVERWAQANGKQIRTHQIPNEIFYIIE